MEKPEVYILGGASLAGKTTTAKKLLRRHPMQTLATDPLRRVLWDNFGDIDEAAMNPRMRADKAAMFQMFENRKRLAKDEDWIAMAIENPDFFLQAQIKQFEVVWRRAVMGALACNVERGIPTLVEGLVFPEFLDSLRADDAPRSLQNLAFRAVFIGNQSQDPESQMPPLLAHIAKAPDHWMAGWSKPKIQAYLNVRAHTSRYYQEQAEAHGYPYVEMSEGRFKKAMGRVATELGLPRRRNRWLRIAHAALGR